MATATLDSSIIYSIFVCDQPIVSSVWAQPIPKAKFVRLRVSVVPSAEAVLQHGHATADPPSPGYIDRSAAALRFPLLAQMVAALQLLMSSLLFLFPTVVPGTRYPAG